jgi:cholest-4-en-3-one 26-monooxygenase
MNRWTNRLSEFNFTDSALFVEDIPHAALAALRRNSPIYWNPAPSPRLPNDGFWLVTKHRDILEIEKNTQVFSSHHGLTLADAPPSDLGPPWSMVRDGLTHLDPPEHFAHRQIVAPWFAPKEVATMETRIREIAEEVVDRASALGEVDFANEIALRFSVAVVLGELFGIPREDFARVIHWSDVIAAPKDPEFPRSAGLDVLAEMYEYGRAVFASRQREPKCDVFNALAHAKLRGENLSEKAFLRYFWSLVTGAFDTTASAIAGGMLAFIEHPEQYARLIENSALLPSAVEEILRWETPTIYFRRTTMVDTEIRGQEIKRGDRVIMCYASANRDEDAFINPTTFDIGRNPNDHLSFGRGPHFCLGASLARTEIRIIFEQIAKRRLWVSLRGKPRRAQSNFQNRIKCMPATISARPFRERLSQAASPCRIEV